MNEFLKRNGQKKIDSINRKNNMSPLMQQYNNIKSKYPDAILLFKVNDFYEIFDNDAKLVSDILEITLTKRINPDKKSFTLLAGFPIRAIDDYLPKLVKAGHRVAICEQQ